MVDRTVQSQLDAGLDALARGAWSSARESFTASLAGEESAEAWEGLGWAGWWLADAELTITARERAFRAYRVRGDVEAAGRVAAWLASDFHEFRGEDAVARGWLSRAHRLLDGRPAGPVHGWLALHEGSFALSIDADAEAARRLARRAAELGREFHVPDLEAVGLALEGVALVQLGRVGDGMRHLDEAATIAASEQLQLPVSHSWAFCYLISACDGVGDFSRAGQWCELMRGHADRWGGRQLVGVCRSTYGSVLVARGDWAEAEAELAGAVDDLVAARPGMAASGFVRLAELRARQGRFKEARTLFERAGAHRSAVLGLGALALEEGDAAAAADAAERVLRRLPRATALLRLPALELLVRARAALGEHEAATSAYRELEQAGYEVGTPYVIGRARLTAGKLARAQGKPDKARRACEDALDRFEECGAAYDAALARLTLAEALADLGRHEPAAAEARAARRTLDALGASTRASSFTHDDAAADEERRALFADLTPRELEILQLVAEGLSDAEIAERLVLSPHTVHRHVANVRTKLRLPSRAAAVAYAARAGLL